MANAQCQVWKYRGDEVLRDIASDRPENVSLRIHVQSLVASGSCPITHWTYLQLVGSETSLSAFHRVVRFQFCHLSPGIVIRDVTAL